MEEGVVGAAGGQDALQVAGPADVGDVRRVALVLLGFGSLEENETQIVEREAEQQVELQVEPPTFPQAGEAVELHQAQVVPGDQDAGRQVGVHRVDGRRSGVFWPDAADL